MDSTLRQSWPARITAVGFIMIVVFGNLWLTLMVLGANVPSWLQGGFSVGMLTTMLGGGGLLIFSVVRKCTGHAIVTNDEAMSDDQP